MKFSLDDSDVYVVRVFIVLVYVSLMKMSKSTFMSRFESDDNVDRAHPSIGIRLHSPAILFCRLPFSIPHSQMRCKTGNGCAIPSHMNTEYIPRADGDEIVLFPYARWHHWTDFRIIRQMTPLNRFPYHTPDDTTEPISVSYARWHHWTDFRIIRQITPLNRFPYHTPDDTTEPV